MNSKVLIKLTEEDLHSIIRESVCHILEEQGVINEGWKNWAMAGALGAASMFGNPQTANAQTMDDMYFPHRVAKAEKEKNNKIFQNMRAYKDSNWNDLEDYGNNLKSSTNMKTFSINLNDEYGGGDDISDKLSFICNNGNLIVKNSNLVFSIPLDKNGQTTPSVKFFNTILQKASEWKKICDGKDVHNLSKEMNLSFDKDVANVANSMKFVFVTKGYRVGVNIIKYRGGEPIGALFINMSDLQDIINLLSNTNTNSIPQQNSNYNDVYDELQ